MKLACAILSMFFCLNLLAAEVAAPGVVDLAGKDVNLGTISNPEYAKATQTFVFKRTAKTPEKVTVNYELLFVRTECVEFAVEVTAVPELKRTVCTANLNGGHECTEAVFEGYQTAKRVCKKQGLMLDKGKKSFELNFKKAVKLSPNADETFEVNIAQNSMQDVKATLKARALETDSLYTVKAKEDEVKFKAE